MKPSREVEEQDEFDLVTEHWMQVAEEQHKRGL